MSTLLIAIIVGVAFLVAYYTYGRWLGTKIFELASNRTTPAQRLRDGRDYVPTPKSIVFGHHFTSIAATGPIVGPAIAVMWGWLPALLWVAFGSIFIGAVHDFGSLVVSLRNNGQSVGDIAGRVLNRRVRLMFFFVLFLALTIIIAIFGLVIAAVFRQYPATIFPVMVQIPIAVVIGLWLHRQGVSLVIPSIIALALMYLSVIFGDWGPLHTFNATLAQMPTIVWVGILLIYSYVASVIPVWVLLQPRDYINSLQLVSALGLVLLGLLVAAVLGGKPPVEGGERQPLEIAAPMVQWNPEGAPIIIPFLFITVACGAISGFHCLVSSGTTAKQLQNEADAQAVGYGSMLTEGLLATIVILACVAGLGLGTASASGGKALTGVEAWTARYASWTEANALGAKVGAFVDGSANFLAAMGIPVSVAVALMGVFVASFAATTLDSATRLQRYVVQELAAVLAPRPGFPVCAHCGKDISSNVSGTCPECGTEIDRHTSSGRPSLGLVAANPFYWLTNRYAATLVAVAVAGVIAAMPAPGAGWSWATAGTGGMILWPMFGATNQLMAGLAFLVIAFWLWRRGKPVFFLAAPMLLMLIVPAWAMFWQVFIANAGGEPGWVFQDSPNYVLIFIAVATLILQAWMVVEAVLLWPRARNVLEPALEGAAHQPAADPNPTVAEHAS